jgi:hypothetical protein
LKANSSVQFKIFEGEAIYQFSQVVKTSEAIVLIPFHSCVPFDKSANFLEIQGKDDKPHLSSFFWGYSGWTPYL